MKKLFKDLEGHGYGQDSVVMPVVQDDKTDLERRLTVVRALDGFVASPAEPLVAPLAGVPLVLVPECGLGTLPSQSAVGGNPSDLSYREQDLVLVHSRKDLRHASSVDREFLAFVLVSEKMMSLAWKYFKRTLLVILVLFFICIAVFVVRVIRAGNVRQLPEVMPLVYGGFNCGWNTSSTVDIFTCKEPPQSKRAKFNQGERK